MKSVILELFYWEDRPWCALFIAGWLCSVSTHPLSSCLLVLLRFVASSVALLIRDGEGKYWKGEKRQLLYFLLNISPSLAWVYSLRDLRLRSSCSTLPSWRQELGVLTQRCHFLTECSHLYVVSWNLLWLTELKWENWAWECNTPWE